MVLDYYEKTNKYHSSNAKSSLNIKSAVYDTIVFFFTLTIDISAFILPLSGAHKHSYVVFPVLNKLIYRNTSMTV